MLYFGKTITIITFVNVEIRISDVSDGQVRPHFCPTSNTLTRTVVLSQIGANECYQKGFKKLKGLVAHL